MRATDASGYRINLHPDDGPSQMRALLNDKRVKVVQFERPLPNKLFERLNDELFSARPEIELRAYGFYRDICDLNFCRLMPNVERFRADCLQSAKGIECVANMPRLTLLGISILELESFCFLERLSPSIKSLTLGETRSRKPDLSLLARFKKLNHLLLASQQKSIEAISGLETLETVSFWGLSLENTHFLSTLPALRQLTFTLGGTRNLDGLAKLQQLRSLEFCWVKKLTNVDVVAEMVGLEELVLDRLAHINPLPSLSTLTKPRKLRLNSLRSLSDISELVNAPALKDLIHTEAKTQPEDYLPVLRKGTLENASVWFGSKAKNETFEKYRLEARARRGAAWP